MVSQTRNSSAQAAVSKIRMWSLLFEGCQRSLQRLAVTSMHGKTAQPYGDEGGGRVANFLPFEVVEVTIVIKMKEPRKKDPFCRPDCLRQWSRDYHEAGHVVVEYVVHEKRLAEDAELHLPPLRAIAPAGANEVRSGGHFRAGTRDHVWAVDNEGPCLDEVWGDLGGPCAEWIERNRRGCTMNLFDWLDWLSEETCKKKGGEARDDLSKAIQNMCRDCMGNVCHKQNDVFPQALKVHDLLVAWWPAVQGLVKEFGRVRGKEGKKQKDPDVTLGGPQLAEALRPFDNGRDAGAFASEVGKCHARWSGQLCRSRNIPGMPDLGH